MKVGDLVRLLPGPKPTVGEGDWVGIITGFRIGAEPDDRVGDLARGARAARVGGSDRRVLARLRKSVPHRRQGWSWRDSVHQHTVLAQRGSE